MASKKKVLIVEDDATTLKIYTLRLTADGFDVVSTSSAHDIVNLISTHHPDMFIIDIMLQDGQGFEVIKKIRTISGYKKKPIIALSNLSQQVDIDRAIRSGANKYLVKSNTSFQEIVDTMNTLLQ